MGAVPDGAIVLFSGLGPDAQNQLSVGVGALAGSTIMLLTVPWGLSILAGRVNLAADGSANYSAKPKLTPGISQFRTGVAPTEAVARGGKVMILTSISYFLIQGPAFVFHCGKKASKDCHGSSEKYQKNVQKKNYFFQFFLSILSFFFFSKFFNFFSYLGTGRLRVL